MDQHKYPQFTAPRSMVEFGLLAYQEFVVMPKDNGQWAAKELVYPAHLSEAEIEVKRIEAGNALIHFLATGLQCE